MATQLQIEANRRNAARSSGPKSDEGKARSRANATRHGMAAESAEVVEARNSAAFEKRRAEWAEAYRPSGPAAEWALDRVVASSLRIEQCERATDGLIEATAKRARLAWDEDRHVEAATLAAGLAKAPGLVSRKLATTYHGAGILIELWECLDASLEAEGSWSEAECSTALDLLGLPADLRRGSTPIDGPDGGDIQAFRRSIVVRELARLDGLREESLTDLDDLARDQAIRGHVALLGKEAKLILRYERDAWRRYRESLRELQAPTISPMPAVASVAPQPASKPKPPPPPAPKPPAQLDLSDPSFAGLARILDGRNLGDLSDEEFEEMIEELDSRPDLAGFDLPSPASERTQFAGAAG